MKVQALFDPATFTLTYVVFDETSGDAVVIDPVLDYDPLAGDTSSASLEKSTPSWPGMGSGSTTSSRPTFTPTT